MRIIKFKKAAVVGAVTVTIVGGGMAIAAWLSTGTGSTSSATAGTAQALTVSAGAPATGLVPMADKVVNATVTNPNPYPVKLATVTAGPVTVDATHETAGCTVAASKATTVVPDSTTISGWSTIARNGGTLNVPVTVQLGVDSDNACQGAQFTVNLTVTGSSSS